MNNEQFQKLKQRTATAKTEGLVMGMDVATMEELIALVDASLCTECKGAGIVWQGGDVGACDWCGGMGKSGACGACELSERAPEAGTPATAVQMPGPYNWCDPNAKYSMSQLQAYGDARAEEARREAYDIARKATYWWDTLLKCARIIDVPVEDPIPTSVLEWVTKQAAQPVAAAQADEVFDSNDRHELMESYLSALSSVPAAAAPTAQPTPPDDELSIEEILRLVADHTGKRVSLSLAELDQHIEFARAVCTALRHPPVTNVGGMTTTPMCERKTDDIVAREGYQKTGYVLMKDDPAARICVSDQGAVSWFTRDQWNWLMHNRDHVEFQWPKPIAAAQPTQAGAEPAAAATIELPSPLLYYRADEDGDIIWGEDCVCVDDVYSSGTFAEAEEPAGFGCKAFSEKQMRAAIAAARQEGALEREAHLMQSYAPLMDVASATARIAKAETEAADLRARLASAGAGEKGGA